jgi:phosphatidylglycerophosphatase A
VQTLARIVATVGGVGYAPVASGTVGALVAVPAVPWLLAVRDREPLWAAVILAGVVALAIWSAGRAEAAFGRRDDGRIVVDEVAGMLLAGALLPKGWMALVLAFFVFRLLDVVKPPPARWIDQRVHGGIGVVGDDLVAGLYAGLLVRALVLLASTDAAVAILSGVR